MSNKEHVLKNEKLRWVNTGWQWVLTILLIMSSVLCVYAETLAIPRIVESKKFPVYTNQGVAVGKKYFYAISNTSIQQCDKSTGRVLKKWQADTAKKEFAHFKHLNSGTVVGDKLYCAHSRYGIDPNDCSVEIWNIAAGALEHERTIPLPRIYGSLTWIDIDQKGDWWMCYAVYGKNKNRQTKLLKYRYEAGKFIMQQAFSFPDEVVSQWGRMSCSGGSWGPDGILYTTGHDHPSVYLLQVENGAKEMDFLGEVKGLEIEGQAISWERGSEEIRLWGVVKNKHVSAHLMSSVKH
jgi:hypothetical protein